MKLVAYHPCRSFQHEVNRIFDNAFSDPESGRQTSGWYPRVDVVEEKDAFVIYAELPGVKAEEVKIRINNHVLTITGEKRADVKSEGQNYYRVERVYGNFQRSFTFPGTVDSEKIGASFKDGVLTVTLAKQEKALPKEIPIVLT
ncbi:MAG: Hsp20/alpha crystallin family protein [candidate division Zixibacteria bacterium]|nr:Hsp20/alpha crystallin family protein [candidate division Zixibacteria bacterium]